MYEAWEAFQEVLLHSPNHGFEDEVVFKFFYQGLDKNNQAAVNSLCGGAIMDHTFLKVKEIL